MDHRDISHDLADRLRAAAADARRVARRRAALSR
jgi:hypothetical protein